MTDIIVNDKLRFDLIEAANAARPQVDLPLVHRFTPGMYIREIHMPAGTLVTSAMHKTEHPFILSKGSVLVWKPGEKPVRLTAPHTGITTAGTQRLLYIEEEAVWVTVHNNPTDTQDIEEIDKRLVARDTNQLTILSEEELRKCLSPQQQQ